MCKIGGESVHWGEKEAARWENFCCDVRQKTNRNSLDTKYY